MEALKQSPSYLWVEKETHQDLIDNSLRANTRKAYASDLKGYQEFTGSVEVNKDLLLMYLKHLAAIGRKWATIKRVAYALKVPGIETHLKGLKNLVFDKDASKVVSKKARPLLKEELINALESNISDRDKVLITLSWVGALRISEAVNIKKSDFVRTSNYYLLTLTNSKNIKRGDTQQKLFPYSENETLCPVRMLDKWLSKLEGDEFIFQGYQGKPLTIRAAQKAIKKALGESYQSHSMRRGVLSQGFTDGLTVSQLLHLSGHKHVTSLMEYDSSDFIKNNAITRLI